MPAKSPCFQFYTKEYLSSTFVRRLSYEEQGVYLNLLIMQWEDGTLPNSPVELADMLRLPTEKFASIWQKIERKFVALDGGGLVNERLEREREKQAAFSDKQRTNASNGWKKRRKRGYATAESGISLAIPARTRARQTQTQTQTQTANSDLLPETDRVSEIELEQVYADYPRKEGKAKGMAKLRAIATARTEFEKFKLAVGNYAASGTQAQFWMHFSTFANGGWLDWVTPHESALKARASPQAQQQNGLGIGQVAPRPTETRRVDMRELMKLKGMT